MKHCRSGLFQPAALLCGRLFCLAAISFSFAQAQEAVQPPADNPPNAVTELTLRQSQLTDRYARLEDLLMRMMEFERTTNPRRSAVLEQTLKQSKDRLTLIQLNQVVENLKQNSLKGAVEGQEAVQIDLKALLDLLLSEDRQNRNASEMQRIKQAIKQLRRIERMQRSNRGRTEGGANLDELAENQSQIADRTEQVQGDIEEIESNDEGSSVDNDSEPTEGNQNQDAEDAETEQGNKKAPPPKDSAPSEEQSPQSENDAKSKENNEDESDDPSKSPDACQDAAPKENSPDGENPSNGDSKKDASPKTNPSPGKSQGDQEAPPSPSDESDDESQSSQSPSAESKAQNESPAQQRIRTAQEKMREAERRLVEAKREESVISQKEAEAELRQAIAELEEILRQLREEEVERALATLESRFRKMLEMELKVYERTLSLAQIPEAEQLDDFAIRTNKVSISQQKVILEADRCYTLLLDEGSSIAFPETVEQLRSDMHQVANRLANTKVGRITQGIEEEIIEALEELIAALQKAQREQEQRQQQQQQPGQAGQPQDQPLVNQLAELRMIRSLQLRINKRTRRYARLLDNEDDLLGQATDDDLRQALSNLSDREARVQRITRDIALGKNN